MRADITPWRTRAMPKNWPCHRAAQHDPRGKRALVQRSKDGPLLWDLAALEPVPGDWVALHPDGERAFRRLDGATMELCDVRTGAVSCTLATAWLSPSPYDPFATWRLDQDLDDEPRIRKGQKVTIPIVDLRTGEKTRELDVPMALGAWLPGSRLAACDLVGKIEIWDVETGERTHTLPGFARKPSWMKVDPAGTRILVYSVHKKGESIAKLWDATRMELLFERKMSSVSFGHHVAFAGSTRVLGDLAVWDLERDVIDELWLGVYFGSPHVRSLVPCPDSPWHAVLTCRDRSDIKRHLEVWDAARRVRLGIHEIEGGRAEQLIAGQDGACFVLHSVVGRPAYDDAEDPTVSAFRVIVDADAPDPEQPAPGSYFFEKV